MGTDDGLTFVRERRFRALVTCTTCGAVVMGPAADYEPAAAFALGRDVGQLRRALEHIDTCAGGTLRISVEEIPAEHS